jgi:Ca2+-binding EF-hand superfamily protein
MKIKQTLVALTMVTGLALFANNALAASPFEHYDTNGDGKITKQEYLAKCTHGKKKCLEEFNWYDRNKDGVITKEEMDAAL